MPETPARSVRVPDDIWTPALRRADLEGTTVTAIITDALRDYAHGEPQVIDTLAAVRAYSITPPDCATCGNSGEWGWGEPIDAGDGDTQRQCSHCGRYVVMRATTIRAAVRRARRRRG